MKRCCTCKQLKIVTEFHKNSSVKDGLNAQCKNCNKIVKKKYRKNNKAKIKDYNLKQYGISLDGYNKIFQKQQGKCAICGIHQSELYRSLDVDHNHNSGKVRGLLCNSCNMKLGIFEAQFDNFINYLRRQK